MQWFDWAFFHLISLPVKNDGKKINDGNISGTTLLIHSKTRPQAIVISHFSFGLSIFVSASEAEV